MQKVSADKFFIFAKATNISIFKQTFGRHCFKLQTVPACKPLAVILDNKMRKPLHIFCIFIFACITTSISGQVARQDSVIHKTDTIDLDINYKDPVSVVRALIWAVEKKNFDVFRYIIDPIDNKGAISSATGENQKFLEKLVFQLTDIQITGQPVYNSNRCKIPISFTQEGRKIKDKFDLINRFGNWYIYKY